jgi:hypothetical protein
MYFAFFRPPTRKIARIKEKIFLFTCPNVRHYVLRTTLVIEPSIIFVEGDLA